MRGTPKKSLYYHCLAWERLQIDTNLLLIITSTADDFSRDTNIDVLERPGTPK